MVRLDSLSLKELNKLYWRSAWLSHFGTLLILSYIVGFFFSFGAIFATVPVFAIAGVFKCIRSSTARYFFFSLSGFGIFSSVLTIFVLLRTTYPCNRFLWIIVASIVLFVSIEIFKSARTKVLFEPNYFSHEQIALARKMKRKNESFIDEELPQPPFSLILEPICTSIAFMAEFVGIIFFIILMSKLQQPATQQSSIQQSSIQQPATQQSSVQQSSTQQSSIQQQAKQQSSKQQPSKQQPSDENLKQAYQAVEQKKYNNAFKLFQKAAENDIPEGHYGLGLCYENSWGTLKNVSKAANHFEVAADKGNPKAQYSLGMIYYRGKGRIQNFAKAASLLEKSANQGNKDAQEMLSYRNGKKPDTSKISFAEQLKTKYQRETQKK